MEEMHVLLRNRGKIIPTDAKSYMLAVMWH